jgi:hypothetical protein
VFIATALAIAITAAVASATLADSHGIRPGPAQIMHPAPPTTRHIPVPHQPILPSINIRWGGTPALIPGPHI